MNKTYNLLNLHSIFGALKPSRLEYLSINSKIIKISKKGFLERNDKTVYFLLSGKLKICELDLKGDEVIKYILREGHFFGESTNAFCFCEFEFAKSTSGQCIAAALPKMILDELLATEAEFSQQYSQLILHKCVTIEDQLRTLMLKDTKERLMRFLHLMAQKEGEQKGDKLIVKNYLTQSEIASLIGATRVTVTKFLSELRTSGNIHYNRHEFQFDKSGVY